MSNSPAMISPMTRFALSSTKGMAQPPWVNPFVGSSSGPPGPSMIPWTVTCVIAMILLMVSLRLLGFQLSSHDQAGERDQRALHQRDRRPHNVPRDSREHGEDQDDRAVLLELVDRAPRGAREE